MTEKIFYRGLTIEIIRDDYPMNPREEFDNLSTMICFHSRYDLGDKHDFKEPLDLFADLADMDKYEYTEEDMGNKLNDMEADGELFIYPVYMYDHSGIKLSLKPFSCPWDSGQVGYMYILKPEMNKAGIRDWSESRVREIFECELEEYNQYLCGDVWQYEIIETGDSLTGFYGDDYETNGLLENAKAYIDHTIDSLPEDYIKLGENY